MPHRHRLESSPAEIGLLTLEKTLWRWFSCNQYRWDRATLERRHGKLGYWEEQLSALPDLSADRVDLEHGIRLEGRRPLNTDERKALMNLSPWRKGPYEFFGATIDTEWHSNLKWDRLAPHLPPLDGLRALDVGGGNGYFSFRLCAGKPKLVVCLEPMGLYWAQYRCLRRYLPDTPVVFLPIKLEDFTDEFQFDVILSLGVLYHVRDFRLHLRHLRKILSGCLYLETLVMPEDYGGLRLNADQRYASMRNVWYIPTVTQMIDELDSAGFNRIKCLDCSVTSIEEQRSTDWMRFNSLPDTLSPTDASKTIEGYPAPTRALFVAHYRR